jgi:hypothetical protein
MRVNASLSIAATSNKQVAGIAYVCLCQVMGVGVAGVVDLWLQRLHQRQATHNTQLIPCQDVTWGDAGRTIKHADHITSLGPADLP